MTRIRLLVVLCLLLMSEGCFLQKKAAVRVPVAVPAAASAPAAAPQPVPKAAPVPASPAKRAPAAAAPATTPSTKPSPFGTTAPATPAPASPVPVAPIPTPALGTILTADQRKKLDVTYQSDVRQANAVLNGLKGRNLTPDQTETVGRARAFIAQAAQYHDRDLNTAAELARRARVLTQDLAGTLK